MPNGIHQHARDTELISFDRQGELPAATYVSTDTAVKAMELFGKHYRWDNPIRSIGVRGAETLERAVDAIRQRFGANNIQRCAMLQDWRLTGFIPKADHVIHPISFFR